MLWSFSRAHPWVLNWRFAALLVCCFLYLAVEAPVVHLRPSFLLALVSFKLLLDLLVDGVIASLNVESLGSLYVRVWVIVIKGVWFLEIKLGLWFLYLIPFHLIVMLWVPPFIKWATGVWLVHDALTDVGRGLEFEIIAVLIDLGKDSLWRYSFWLVRVWLVRNMLDLDGSLTVFCTHRF